MNAEHDYQWAVYNDPLVQSCVKAGLPREETIVKLVERHIAMQKELVKVMSICPKKITSDNGDVFIWHSPDHLIP